MYHELRKRGTSAADLKFLQRLQQARPRNFKSKSGTRIIELLVPLCFRSSCQRMPQCITNFGSGALGVRRKAVAPTETGQVARTSGARVWSLVSVFRRAVMTERRLLRPSAHNHNSVRQREQRLAARILHFLGPYL